MQALTNDYSKANTDWILDTGASDHVACSLSLFTSHRIVADILITLPTGHQVKATHIGDVTFSPTLKLTGVLYVPDFNFNLISVSKLAATQALCLTFTSDSCVIQDKQLRTTIGSAKLHRGLYHMAPSILVSQATSSSNSDVFDLWHYRLGHTSHTRIPYLQHIDRSISTYPHLVCDVCHFAKQRRLSFPSSQSVTLKPFDVIHVDIWGPSPQPSHSGFRYFLTIVDDHSRHTWLILMKLKSEARPQLQQFCTFVHTQYNCTVKIIRSDQGKEFDMPFFYREKGIFHQTTCVETPQQNSRVERKHQHILNVARALRFQAKLPIGFWSDCVRHAVFLINRVPSPILDNKTPFELLHNKKPSLSELKVLGCLCFASTLANHRTKFEHRARKCVFIGYTSGIKGFRLYDLMSHQIFTSRDVFFYEHIFPLAKDTQNTQTNFEEDFVISPTIDFDLDPPILETNTTIVPPLSETATNTQNTEDQPGEENNQTQQNYERSESENENENENESENTLTTNNTPPQNNLRKTSRQHKPPRYLQDYHCDLLVQSGGTEDASNACSAMAKGSVSHPLSNVLCYDNLYDPYKKFVLSITSLQEPQNYADAVKESRWRDAMKAELEALKLNETWSLVELPPGKKAIGNKWVYRIKYKSDGRIERFKARLVAKGYTQLEGIDYQETFAPVVKMTTIRTFLAMASIQKWHLHQLDINNAFLHGELEEEVYMKLPLGLETSVSSRNTVCRLHKSLYGLKQASRQWFSRLSDTLKQQGYMQSKVDYSLFLKNHDGHFTAALVYVDDLILGGNNLLEIESLKRSLNDEFKIKDLGTLKFFLGLEVARNHEGIHLSQRKYTLEILEEAGFLSSKPVTTPMDSKVHLSSSGSEPFEDGECYRRLVGKLIYLTNTRPDISFATQQVSQFMGAPTEAHYKAATRILRYLKSAPASGLFFPTKSSMQLKAYSDSDWAACPDSRRSVTGYAVYLGDSLISWKSKKQTTISRSSCEAEYRALAHTACELQWLLYLLQELYVPHSMPATIFCDNQSAIHIAENPTFHERTKHIELDCHLVREKVQANVIKLLHVTSSHQVADMFTKPLAAPLFHFLLSKLGVHNLCPPACGGVSGEGNFSKT
ncbi:Retrovirus-related Pol polyprotein from transposon TNT 1-94 [Linum perenne]